MINHAKTIILDIGSAATSDPVLLQRRHALGYLNDTRHDTRLSAFYALEPVLLSSALRPWFTRHDRRIIRGSHTSVMSVSRLLDGLAPQDTRLAGEMLLSDVARLVPDLVALAAVDDYTAAGVLALAYVELYMQSEARYGR